MNTTETQSGSSLQRMVRLRYLLHECYDEEMDFLDALRNTCGGNFTADAKTEETLDALRDDLLRIDEQHARLAVAKPEMAERYRAQHRYAENEISKQIMRLGLHDVRAA